MNMDSNHTSVAIIISAGGSVLDNRSLHDLPLARPLEADFATAELATCVALRLEHACSREELRRGLNSWASARGWSVAVAPVRRSG